MKKFISLALVLVFALSLAACSSSSSESYDLGNGDRARVFYDTYNKYVEEYGEAAVDNGVLKGAAVVRLCDFTGDSIPELLIAFPDEKDGGVKRVMVCGFDMGFAELYNEEITSKGGANDPEALWIYTDSSGLSYLVIGDDLSKSRSYICYQQADSEGKPLYEFAEAFSTDGDDLGGEYEKIKLTDNTDSKAIFEKNKGVIDALESQKN